MSEWQPIETAPVGKPVILFYPEAKRSRPPFDVILGKWITVGVVGSTPRNPTHWMPLPPPPTETPEYIMPQFKDVLDTVNALSIRSKE